LEFRGGKAEVAGIGNEEEGSPITGGLG